jgi:light-regulated signal transduction histidine kinase (bacteriophytochrome)
LEDFANAAAHDLKEPLRSIASFSYLLEKDLRNVLDERSSEYFKYIKDATNRMQRLIMDLLTYAKIGVEDKPFGPVDLNEIMETVKSGLKTILEAERALINFRGLPTIIADKSMMRQLFQNLISNAVKFHKPDVAPVINVFAEEKPDGWKIAVNDNGIGIEEKFYEKVFVVFSRLHTRDKYEGTGIGLSLCKKIVDKHEGRIWIDSKLGEGTTFYITIPKKPGAVV